MELSRRLYEWVVDHNENPMLVLLSVCLPDGMLLESILRRNRETRQRACLTISFDCDYPGDVTALPQLVRLLSGYPFKASFACVGHWIEQYPKEHSLLVEQGHEIVNHTYSHPDNELLNPGRRFKTISSAEKIDELVRCHEACRRVLHYEPAGCRIPHFKHLFTPEIYGILKGLGYTFSSSTWLTNSRSCGMPFVAADGIIEFPLTTCPVHPFSVFDTWHSFNSPRLFYRLGHRNEARYIDLFKWLVTTAIATGSYINIYLDPGDAVKMRRFNEMLEFIQQHRQTLTVATYGELVRQIKHGVVVEHAARDPQCIHEQRCI